ncbi:MAG: 4-hydroxythreonine-4-phosphate dehydrogenase PdxA [Planctomycetes bacterium]|nr:4-hydroxythreonine-4-phosphate dehydrogenase PdxA [Planctomycetota bacterium]
MDLSKTVPIIGVTIGDPAGIGPEIVAKALAKEEVRARCLPVAFGDACVLRRAVDVTGVPLRVVPVADPRAATGDPSAIEVIDSAALASPVPFGEISAEGGRAAVAAIDRAIEEALAGRIDAIATAPIQKESLRAARVPEIDHTAILGARTGARDPMTLFVTGRLRIFFLTRHLPLREVAGAIRTEDVRDALVRAREHLRALGIDDPNLAVAALNPHGGEHGLFGDEEERIIEPGVRAAREAGARVAGIIPADSVFHLALEGAFDGVLSLYHDQGHIAAKTYDFYGTVSFTMGLPFLRTSVDHGTAFPIAGKNAARSRSMEEAIVQATAHAPAFRRHREGRAGR